MSEPVTLLMAVHCHQPVGNFDFVFEEAYAKSYDPFLRALERHPGVHLALHYSGSLLDWLAAHQPGFIRRIRALAQRGQIELLSGGYYEPILPLIPDADRQAQLALMRQALQERFGQEPRGLWLTERVWEPELPRTLAQAGIRYTALDTNQFQLARAYLPDELQVEDERFWDVLGCYTTDYAGDQIILFPSSNRLRYWLPFEPVDRTIELLRRLQGRPEAAITFADDGEKFGLWPTTYDWVYERGWLDQWFSAIERESGWLRALTFREYLASRRPAGRVSLPCGSYDEMLIWSQGHFRNFLLKYPEANAMQQKMLAVSRSLQAINQSAEGGVRNAESSVTIPNSELRTPNSVRLLEEAKRHLYQAQCNCAYWHGVFGGLYLSHLRRAVHHHLIAAEQIAAQLSKRIPSARAEDRDGDGHEEITLRTAAMQVVVDPMEGGSLIDWSLFRSRVNLADTLTRRRESYHEALKAKAGALAAAGPTSIHELVGTKEEGLASYLVYDDHRRVSFLDYGLQDVPSLAEVHRSAWGERRLWSPAPCEVERLTPPGRGAWGVALRRSLGSGQARKTVFIEQQGRRLACGYEVKGADAPVVALEFNLSLRDPRYLAPGQVERAERFDIAEVGLNVALTLTVEPAATLLWFPVETVSESEGGLERTYQALALLCCWRRDPAREWDGRMVWTVEQG